MSGAGWAGHPYLDALRPEPGWRTDFAILSTYSMNLFALVAALLALAGLDDERGSGSRVDFANAIDSMGDRVRVLVQRGRIGLPARTPKILGILDRFVREIPMDEAVGSWHPKVSLVRFESEADDAVEWRLWLGSRNLTADLSWDAGIALCGHASGRGLAVPGVAELGRRLSTYAGLGVAPQAQVHRELGTLRWEMPEGCTVQEIRLLEGPGRKLPETPKDLHTLTVVSPFLDGAIVRELGHWGDRSTHRVLLSSQRELSKLALQKSQPLAPFAELLSLDAPDGEDSADTQLAGVDSDNAAGEPSEDAELGPRGLHAKLIYAEHGKGRTLWLGSANATRRGWVGPNSEVIARIGLSAATGDGLKQFVEGLPRTEGIEALPQMEPDELEESLEQARRQVAARWAVVQRVDEGRPVLEAKSPMHPDDSQIELSVGLLGQPATIWPRAAAMLHLPPLSQAEQTELLCCGLKTGERSLSWVQHTPLDPPPGEERDRRALARYLDPRTFLLWVRSLLAGDALLDGGGDWDQQGTRRPASPRNAGPEWWAPTVEEVLRAWARDPSSVLAVDRKVRGYLQLMETERTGDDSKDDLEVLAEFRRTWSLLRGELLGPDQ